MCFSATASFTSGAALLIVGVVTARRARRPAELPFALIPTLFGLQQLIEGAIWLTLPDKAPLLNTVLTTVYSLFSHVLWPAYVPVAVLLIEPVRWRRRGCQVNWPRSEDGQPRRNLGGGGLIPGGESFAAESAEGLAAD